ncbi:MAG: flap endonuclease [Clostridia bacterium]|nr:flap endonuclease [Clostridia bacterium]
MKPKLLLVDGSNLLFQMFYGMPARIVNEDGIAIHGVIGFVGALLKIIRMTAPTHIAVWFDGESTNERYALDRDYKANRPDYGDCPEEEQPFSQLPYIKTALDCLGILHKETEHCEVDDWMAAYVSTYGCEIDTVIASFDSDFFQLVSNRVSILRYRGDATTLVTPETVYEKFGITPMQYADFKALVGDKADNIKGIDGIGVKTAARLLQSYGTLDGVLKAIDKITPARLQNALREGIDRVTLNRKLITLTGSTPLPHPIEALAYQNRNLTTTEVLKTIGLKR